MEIPKCHKCYEECSDQELNSHEGMCKQCYCSLNGPKFEEVKQRIRGKEAIIRETISSTTKISQSSEADMVWKIIENPKELKKIYDTFSKEERSVLLKKLIKTYEELSWKILHKTQDIVSILDLRVYADDYIRDGEIGDFNVYIMSLGKAHFDKILTMSEEELHSYVVENKYTYKLKPYHTLDESHFMKSRESGFDFLTSIRVLNQIYDY